MDHTFNKIDYFNFLQLLLSWVLIKYSKHETSVQKMNVLLLKKSPWTALSFAANSISIPPPDAAYQAEKQAQNRKED